MCTMKPMFPQVTLDKLKINNKDMVVEKDSWKEREVLVWE